MVFWKDHIERVDLKSLKSMRVRIGPVARRQCCRNVSVEVAIRHVRHCVYLIACLYDRLREGDLDVYRVLIVVFTGHHRLQDIEAGSIRSQNHRLKVTGIHAFSRAKTIDCRADELHVRCQPRVSGAGVERMADLCSWRELLQKRIRPTLPTPCRHERPTYASVHHDEFRVTGGLGRVRQFTVSPNVEAVVAHSQDSDVCAVGDVLGHLNIGFSLDDDDPVNGRVDAVAEEEFEVRPVRGAFVVLFWGEVVQ